ncbi:pentatricopeptide repeat-containing protein at1g66345 mitochondrial [Phtheirospermum japonicum]|uniref:Pentatricopeptide repeat-containing protein at1g66345 mitochondrial n=1 Tax=Phtheirospermum japonicum TaxID=374723 RepID=A0A830D1J5_9LAMI|nr:pentatricopeptide repeat-containing protein at1g66345 mitochondrial [Phtheirospermum japonicum]
MRFQHGLSSYCLLIHILVKARLVKDAKALFESVLTKKITEANSRTLGVLDSLIDTYVTVDSVPLVFDLFIQTCAKLRMVDDILDACKLLFDRGFPLSVISFNTVLHVMQKSDEARLAWGVYNHMIVIKILPNEATVRIMVALLCKEGKLERFLGIVDRMHGKRCSVPQIIVNTCLVYEMIEDGRIEDGLILLKQMLQKNMILDTISYSLVVFAKFKMGNLNSAKEIYDEMLKRGFKENAFVCNLLVGANCEEGRLDEAIGLLEEMERLGVKPVDETFNHLIKGCSLYGRSDDSLVFCEQMTRMGLIPSCSAVNEMFGKLCENGKTKRADEMLTILLDKGFGPDENTYSHLICGYCKDDNMEGLTKILFEMEYRSISPNMSGFNAVIVGLCKCERLEEAEKYLETMKARFLIPSKNIYERLIAGHLVKGDETRACRLYNEMLGMGSNI